MARDISIAISARDNFTQAITTMRNANQHFNKDLEGLSTKLNALNSTKVTLKMDTDKARQALKEAEKQFQKTGDAADEMAVKLASDNYENARRNLDLVSKNAKQAEKDILSLTDAVGRSENRAGGGGAAGGILSSLAGAGLGKMMGDSLSAAADTWVSSAFGDTVGNAISSTLSGAATGAALGSIAGPVGTAVGAAVGLAAGGISAATQYFEKNNEAFKSVRDDLINDTMQKQEDNLSAGSGIASGRETSLISFSTLFGDMDAAKEYLEQMKNMANTTPFLFDDLAQMSKVLKTYGYSREQMLPLLTKVGDTGAALGMSTSDMSMVATSIGRMNSSGKTTLEYLNPLIERGIPAIDYLAEASGKSKNQIYDMVSKGLIPGAEAAKIISDYMGKANEGAMEMQSKTFAGLQSTLQGMNEEMQNAMGDSFNEARKAGIQDQIDYFSGDSGEKMKEANRLIGEWKASLENEKERILRETMDAAMGSEEYQKALAEGNGSEAGRILAQAEIDAQAKYLASEGVDTLNKMHQEMIEATGKTLADNPQTYEAGVLIGNAMGKGIADAARKKALEMVDPDTFMPYADGIQFEDSSGNPVDMFGNPAPGHANGLRYVPRDDYPARLHEGERVLTASEARAYSNDAMPNITFTGEITVREEADIYKIAKALAEELRKARQVS